MFSPVKLKLQSSETFSVVKTCRSEVMNTAAMPFFSQYARPLSAPMTKSAVVSASARVEFSSMTVTLRRPDAADGAAVFEAFAAQVEQE